jgi:hypothetical protein
MAQCEHRGGLKENMDCKKFNFFVGLQRRFYSEQLARVAPFHSHGHIVDQNGLMRQITWILDFKVLVKFVDLKGKKVLFTIRGGWGDTDTETNRLTLRKPARVQHCRRQIVEYDIEKYKPVNGTNDGKVRDIRSDNRV